MSKLAHVQDEAVFFFNSSAEAHTSLLSSLCASILHFLFLKIDESKHFCKK